MLEIIVYILIFDFFLNFLSFVRLQTPTFSTDQLCFVVTWLDHLAKETKWVLDQAFNDISLILTTED